MREIGGSCNLDCENCVMDSTWRFQTNWIVSYGSLENSVTVESLDCPTYDDTENSDRKSPLILKRQPADSSPCEITICFGKMFDVEQVYVRSTARVYEIYYASSPRSFNEYLCTVRCCAAERDEKILQTTDIEYDPREHGGCQLGAVPEDIIGENSVSGDDDWVKIKIPRVGCSSSKETDDNGEKVLQNLFEATAQISDADHCSSLTIRFLSLPNRYNVYVDEVYIYANPVEIIDSGEDSMTSKTMTGNPLMAMLVPALLQSGRSGLSRVNETHGSGGVLRVDSMENRLGETSETSSGMSKNPTDKQCTELLHTPLSAELGQPISSPPSEKSVELEQVRRESVKLQEHDQNRADFNESGEPLAAFGLEHVQSTLEHLITRVGRVEDICLRLEEKLLKPIESMDSRLQKMEHQLEKLSKNSHCTDFPGCTRISAPSFYCSESNSSSFYNERSDPPNEPSYSEADKRTSSDNTSNFIPNIKYHPTLAVSAPEFSLEDEDEDNNDLGPVKDTAIVKPKLSLSVDEALAAAFSGFLSSTISDSCVCVQPIYDSSTVPDENILPCHDGDSSKKEIRGFSAAENDSIASTQFVQILSVQAPDFTVEDSGDEKHLKHIHSSSVMPSVLKNDEKEGGSEIIASHILEDFSSAESVEINGYEKGFCAASNGTLNTVPSIPKSLIVELDVGDDSDFSGSDIVGSSIEEGRCINFVEAKNSLETRGFQSSDEANLKEVCTVNLDNTGITVKKKFESDIGSVPDLKRCLKEDPLISPEPTFPPKVNFEFPIFDVEFSSNKCANINDSLADLFGTSESSTEAPSIHDTADDKNPPLRDFDIMDGTERTEISPSNIHLVDVEAPAENESPNSEGAHSFNSISMPEIIASLI